MTEVASKIEPSLSDEAQEVVHIARRKAKEYMHATIGAPHLLWALLKKETSTYQLVREMGKDIFYLQEWATVRLEAYPKTGGSVSEVQISDEMEEIFKEADQLHFELDHTQIDPVLLLAVLCTPGLVFSYDQLKTFSLTKDELLEAAFGVGPPTQNGKTDQGQGMVLSNGSGTSSSGEGVVQKYCRDLHAEVAEQEHFELVERREDLNTCLEVLTRYAKANLIITGEPGVGKTALIYGLVEKLEDKELPDNLEKAHLMELDLAAMQAGASYKGELEDRFQKVVDELKKMEKPILVIENIHSLVEKNNNLSSLSALLTMELSRGQLTVIGTTTPENFRKNIEKDETFSRRFETLTLKEPDDEVSAKIIHTVIAPHEQHHNMQVESETIKEAIRLAKRYDKERRLPDAAIDLIDRSMARTRITIHKMEQLLEQISATLGESMDEEDVDELSALYCSLRTISDRFLQDHFDSSLREESSFEDDEAFYNYLRDQVKTIENNLAIEEFNILGADLTKIISRKTGIPAGKIQTQERKRLLKMEDVLRERVVGQDGALGSVTEAVLESRSGLLKGKQPIGSFFFLGPTGTGKTELAKALSEFLFQDEQAMIRFDMSEFKEEHSAAMLYGSPPGYVGYEEGGMLVNKIRERPYSVVLFDEIEKAHNSVFDIFLQILDEGKLTDRLGKEGDFSNALILFTSNIASEKITNSFEKDGTLPSSQKLKEELSAHFRPEFLGRLTEIVPFAPISEEVLLRIFEINLNELLEATERKGINLVVESEAKKHLAQLGYSPQYGARPLKGVIRDKIRRPLSRMLIEGSVEDGNNVHLAIGKEDKLTWNIN